VKTNKQPCYAIRIFLPAASSLNGPGLKVKPGLETLKPGEFPETPFDGWTCATAATCIKTCLYERHTTNYWHVYTLNIYICIYTITNWLAVYIYIYVITNYIVVSIYIIYILNIYSIYYWLLWSSPSGSIFSFGSGLWAATGRPVLQDFFVPVWSCM
jgi:hypothetical protein